MSIRTDLKKGLLVFMFPLYLVQPAMPKPDFIVYYAQGNVKKMNSPKKGALKKGDSLYSKDMVSVGLHSQLILVCKNANCIKLEKPDTIRMKALMSRCAENSDSFIVSYFHFVWDELTDKAPNPQAYQHNIGAVSRGAGGGLFIDSINYLRGDLNITFGERPDTVTVEVFDKPANGRLLMTMKTATNNFKLGSLTTSLKRPGRYYWNVPDLQPPLTNRCYLKIWQKKAYADAVNLLLKNVVKTAPAETAFMSGFILEKNGFLTEAQKYYALANKLEPGNPFYHTTYARFL